MNHFIADIPQLPGDGHVGSLRRFLSISPDDHHGCAQTSESLSSAFADTVGTPVVKQILPCIVVIVSLTSVD
jgi:hypothetical protein